MTEGLEFDSNFDFRIDAGGRDPDRYSPSLKKAHLVLWTKPLPDGRLFELADTVQGEYLMLRVGRTRLPLSSDSIIPTYEYWKTPPPYFADIPQDDIDEFARISYTFGGMILFPSEQVDGKPTINQARGTSTVTIGDRFDLTLEAIRRHYVGESSPLSDVLERYSSFFELFTDFRGYVDFFLLQDVVDSGYATIRFFTPFANFTDRAVPSTLDDFIGYRTKSVEFINARNRRVAASLKYPQGS